MAVQLREYQQELIQNIVESWGNGNRCVLAQLPTGAGKTVIFSNIADEFVKREMRVLIIAHREELILQAIDKLADFTNATCGIIKSGYPIDYECLIQVASIQTLVRRKHKPEADLVIIDEAHHSSANSYRSIVNHYSESFVLGVTATPCRTDGQGFNDIYSDLIVGESVRSLINQGFLCDYILIGSEKYIETEDINKHKGEYVATELNNASKEVISEVVEEWYKHAEGKSTVLFAHNVDRSKEITNLFLREGISAEHIDANTPPEQRRDILKRFENKETLVLCNHNIVSEGFDVPGIECVQNLRPTASPIVYLQMFGRGLRPAPGKDKVIFIDHTQNWWLHGLVDEQRKWSLEPQSIDPGTRAAYYSHKCIECNHIFKPLHHERVEHVYLAINRSGEVVEVYRCTCPSCGIDNEFVINSKGEFKSVAALNHNRESELSQIELEASDKTMRWVDSLLTTQQQRGYKKGWIYYQIANNPEVDKFTIGDWRYFARVLGYKSGWAWYKFKEAQGLKSS